MSDAALPPPDRDLDTGRSPLPRVTRVPTAAEETPTTSLYDRVGGEAFFVRLVDAFYERVAASTVLRPLYPDADLAAANERFRLFLIQYWGGPSTYSDTRGHPRLRMRHAPFPVNSTTISAWLDAMDGALDAVAPEPAIRDELWAYFEKAAPFMRNTEG